MTERAASSAETDAFESTSDISLSLGAEDLEEGLTAMVGKVFFFTRRVFDDAVRPYDVTSSQASVLNRILNDPGISGAEISRQMMTTRQAVRLTLVALERKGLVERRSDPDNGRAVQAFLTERGCSVILKCRAEGEEVERQLTKNVDERERRMVIQFLTSYLERSQSATNRAADGDDDRGKELHPKETRNGPEVRKIEGDARD